MQVVLVYLQRFRRNSLLKCVLQPETAKKINWNPLFWGIQGSVLVMIRSKCVSICNRSHTSRVNNCKVTRLMPAFEGNILIPHPAAWNLVTKNYRLYAIIRWKPESISAGLQSTSGCDTRIDGQTDAGTELRQLVHAKHYVLSHVKTEISTIGSGRTSLT